VNVVEIMQKAKDAVDLRQVFGEPYQVGDVTIIPVARAGGGGGGKAVGSRSGGEGYGFGIQPTGVYAIKGDSVKWVPIVNVNTIINGAFAVTIVGMIASPRIIRSAARAAKALR